MAADQEMKSEEEFPEPPGLKRKAAEGSASSKMTLEQLMELSMQRNDEHFFARLDTQLGAVKRDAEVTKSVAAKAVTIADQTNVKVNQLERRVLTLEEGGGELLIRGLELEGEKHPVLRAPPARLLPRTRLTLGIL